MASLLGSEQEAVPIRDVWLCHGSHSRRGSGNFHRCGLFLFYTLTRYTRPRTRSVRVAI